MREPAVRKTLYWCEKCNVPLLGRRCACGAEGKAIPLLRPYDARPALAADRGIITGLLRQHFGTESLPRVVILNKTSGRDRNDLIIANGDRFGWLSFDPSSGKYSLELEFGAVPWLLASATRGVIDLTSVGGAYRDVTQGKRIGGKKYPAPVDLPEGPVLMTWEGHAAVGTCRAGSVKVREAGRYIPATYPDPGWDRVISSSISTLKNLERSAIRFIRHHAGRASCVAVSFSGGKDSTVTMELARRAGYGNAFFVDTGMEFPETLGFVRSLGIENILHAKDFWREIEKNGPPHKDDRWCCERQKLAPVKEWLKGKGECITVQGNRWYESFARSGSPRSRGTPITPSRSTYPRYGTGGRSRYSCIPGGERFPRTPSTRWASRGWGAGCAQRCSGANGNVSESSIPTCTKHGWSSWWNGAGGKGWIRRRSLPVPGDGRGLRPRCAVADVGGRGRILLSIEIQYPFLFSHE